VPVRESVALAALSVSPAAISTAVMVRTLADVDCTLTDSPGPKLTAVRVRAR
jgi:hypothetical protein